MRAIDHIASDGGAKSSSISRGIFSLRMRMRVGTRVTCGARSNTSRFRNLVKEHVMHLSEVRISLCGNAGGRLKAFCSLTFDNTFVIRDVKLIEGNDGL